MTRVFRVRPRGFLPLIAPVIVGALAMTLGVEVHAATAAPRWSRTVVVSHTTCPKGLGLRPQAAQNARGDALVAWIEVGCGTDSQPERWRVVAISRKPGHRFGGPRVLGTGYSSTGQTPHQLEVALDARGGGTVAWSREPAYSITLSDPALLVATRQPGRRFGAPRIVDSHGGAFALAANRRGETVLTWKRYIPPAGVARTGTVVAAIRKVGTGRFGEVQTLSGPLGQVGNPAVAIAPDGAALASWGRADGSATDCCTAVEAAIRQPGGRFGGHLQISPASRYGGQAVAIVNDSGGIVVWTTNPNPLPSSDPGEPQEPGGVFASRWNGQAFSAPLALASAFDWFSASRVLLAQDGQATVEWDQGYLRQQCGLASRHAVTLPAGEPPATPAMISPPNGMQAAFASALDTRGRPIRAWFQVTSVVFERYNNCIIRASRVGAAIDGGPTVHGPAVKKGPGIDAGVALAAAPGSTPMLVWGVPGRVVMSTLRAAR